MKSIRKTHTEHNLLASFAGESQTHTRYRLFAEAARKEGYEQIAAIFEETASQEQTHAGLFFDRLEGGMLEIKGTYPAGKISDTLTNLREARNGEHREWSDINPLPRNVRVRKRAGLFRAHT